MKKNKLLALYRKMQNAELPLKRTAKHLVFGEGDSSASLFFIGEAPGKKEDESGRPFVGAAGRELESVLKAVGLNREDVYITSILKYRPPKNRNPRRKEIKAHTPFLLKQIEIIMPDIIVPLGNYAAEFILSLKGTGYSVGRFQISAYHGKVFSIKLNNHRCAVIPTYHPAAILYNRRLLPLVVSDMKKICRMI